MFLSQTHRDLTPKPSFYVSNLRAIIKTSKKPQSILIALHPILTKNYFENFSLISCLFRRYQNRVSVFEEYFPKSRAQKPIRLTTCNVEWYKKTKWPIITQMLSIFKCKTEQIKNLFSLVNGKWQIECQMLFIKQVLMNFRKKSKELKLEY